MTIKETVYRYGLSTIGLSLVAMGIVFSVKANLGISVLNAPGYAISARFPALSLGFTNTAFFMLCVVFQIILLRRKFKLIDLLQLPANILLGFLIDGFNLLFEKLSLTPEGLQGRIVFLVLAIFIQALGISLEVGSKAWMLPADMTVKAIGTTFGGQFSNNKIKMDCTVLVLSVLLCLVFFGNILGPAGTPIIGWGTLVLAVFIGLAMKLTDPLVAKITG